MSQQAASLSGNSLRIPLPEPFAVDWALTCLRGSSFGTPFDAVRPDGVRRVLRLADQLVAVDFTFGRVARELRVTVVAADPPTGGAATELRRVVSHLWGLDDDLPACHAALGEDPWLRPLLQRYAGLRMVRAASLYEALLSAILGQQISVASAQSMRRRLMGALGGRLGAQADYPAPARLLQAGPEGLLALGITRQKARYLLAVAERAADGALEPARFAGIPDQEAIARLCEIAGVGRWTAEVALMYGLGRPDVCLAGDLALQTAVQRLLGRADRPSERELRGFSERWAGWRSYACLYLLMTLKPGT